jgi:hypothetical protein
VPYETFGNRSIVFWKGWTPFVFCNAIESKTGGAANNNNQHSETAKVYSTITSLRWTIDVEDILVQACASLNQLNWNVTDSQEQTRNRFAIHYVPERENDDSNGRHNESGLCWYQQSNYRLLAHKPEQLGKPRGQNGKALDNLIMPQRVKDLAREIEVWRNHKTWYAKKGIPWKRGWLLYGPPGTGKTALARAFAEDLNMPIYVFNLAELGNYEFIRAWTEMQVNVPCIALIEDVDNVFHGRENVARKGSMFSMFLPKKKQDDDDSKGSSLSPLTFDCLLNCLDGVDRSEGVFTIITTNDISKVDSALGQPRRLEDGGTDFISTRPGRIDKAIELTYMELGDKKRMARRILADYPEQCSAMLAFIDQHADMKETPAQFQERCGQIALACLWKDEQTAKEPRPTRKSGDTWTDLRTPLPEEQLRV